MWFRRDLRLHDNAAFFHALKSASEQGLKVIPLFIFDRDILDKLTDKRDRRVEFIHNTLHEMHECLRAEGSSMLVLYGTPREIWQELFAKYSIREVYCNHDYEQYAVQRDEEVKSLCASNGAALKSFKDHVIFEKSDVLTAEERPYTVFTPYSKKWKFLRNETHTAEYNTRKYWQGFWSSAPLEIPRLEEMNFLPTNADFPKNILSENIIAQYDKTRDFPAQQGTTRLSVHLRFGTVSIRECVKAALRLNETWLNELIWRDFYMQILWHFPHVETSAFKPDYDRIPWREDNENFERWCEGKTGYPIVDAGMRELNATGYMHNRVRMVTASFLTKHLLIDWRRGERYFAAKLLDYDLAANNGGWQWAASTGCDAAPYFRIFNPSSQTDKFDPKLEYIKRWVPELNSFDYPHPIVEHKFARERALQTYKQALAK
jgi:deoxyribodipyrimidine photo-lyase